MKIERWIVSGDYQIPYQDDYSLSSFEKYMAAHKWDGYLHLGDLLDFDSISSFNFGKPGLTEGKRIQTDYDITNKILDRHQAIIKSKNPKARFILLEGNHEDRLERFFATAPQFIGSGLSLEIALKLKQRGFEYVRSWQGEDFSIGKAHFVHGNYTNQYHPAKMATKYGDSVFYGHTHDMMCHALANKFHPDKVIVGQSLGCLCEREQAYMKGKPSNWQQGFGVFHFLPNGNYTYYTPRIFGHKFIGPDGVLYEP